VGGACGRLPGRRGPSPRPDARAGGADSARRDSTRAPADTSARDTTRRDTTRALGDSAARDTVPVRRAPRRDADPSQRCGVVNFNDSPPTSRFQALSDGQGNYINFIGGGVVARCEATGSVLRADSAEYYQTLGQLILVFNVSYDEPRRARLTSQRLTYYTVDERILAEQNVYVTLPSGTSMTGPSVEYLRAVERVRPGSRLTATGRPTLRVVGGAARAAGQAPRAGPDTSITTIVANTIIDVADSVVFASGAVQITRTDLVATSDSATFEQLSEVARLLRNATIRGTRDRPFTMTGARIDLFARERELSRVAARDSAQIVSADLNLRSDTVDLRLRDGKLERATAWGPSRAVASSPSATWSPTRSTRCCRASACASCVRSPRRGALGHRHHAPRQQGARRAARRHHPRPVRHGARDRRHGQDAAVRRIRALGNASSLYQIANQRGRLLPPSINYVRGRNIMVDFDSGQVQTVTVTDSASGVYLQPADSAADSTGAAGPVPVPGVPSVVPVPTPPPTVPAGNPPAGGTAPPGGTPAVPPRAAIPPARAPGDRSRSAPPSPHDLASSRPPHDQR
jgi:hypothetical protein